MIKSFSDSAWADYEYWFQQNDKTILKRIHKLLKDIETNGNSGIGKPEPLKFDLSGWWSRRINDEHRIVYRINHNESNDTIEILQLRYHYDK